MIRYMVAVFALLSACGSDQLDGDTEGMIDLDSVESGIYIYSGQISTDCTYDSVLNGTPTSFENVPESISVDAPAHTIEMPFRFYPNALGGSDRVELSSADKFAFSGEYENDCGMFSVEFSLSDSDAGVLVASGTKVYSNIPSSCELTDYPVSDCTITGEFTYELQETCAEPCTVVELPRDSINDPRVLACECD